MSDTSQKPRNTAHAQASLEDLTRTSDWHGAPDSVLARMADFADAARAGTNVTLIIPGGMISGTIESAQDYFSATSSRLRADVAQLGDEHEDKLADDYARLFFDSTAKAVADQVEQDNAAFDKGEIPTARWPLARHIHLANAHFSVPGQYAFELGHVRLLLSQVIGWTVGENRMRTQSGQ
jgi:hypothetical protein